MLENIHPLLRMKLFIIRGATTEKGQVSPESPLLFLYLLFIRRENVFIRFKRVDHETHMLQCGVGLRVLTKKKTQTFYELLAFLV